MFDFIKYTVIKNNEEIIIYKIITFLSIIKINIINNHFFIIDKIRTKIFLFYSYYKMISNTME